MAYNKEWKEQFGMKVWRQGDVVLRRHGVADDAWVSAVAPVGGFKAIVLAEGEKTGHNHTLEVDEPTGEIKLFERGGRLWLKVEGASATLKHQEHGPITVDPGVYEFRRQQEYAEGKAPREISD